VEKKPDSGRHKTLLQLKADLAAGAKSTWRPAEGASANDVAMQVGDSFASVWTVVEHQTESGFAQPQFISNLGGFEQNMAQDLFLFRLSLGDARDWLFRDDQDVNWGLRFNVVKGQDQIILINDFSGDLAVNNLFEKGLAHGKGTWGGKRGASTETSCVVVFND